METENPTTEAGRIAAHLAREHGIPSHNLQGDPLVTCTCCGTVIYAVAALGGLRNFCADCRANIGTGNVDPWAGPVDPVAREQAAREWFTGQPRRMRREDMCGCGMRDVCDECMHYPSYARG